MSGGSVVLLCTDTITQLQWLNGTVSLDDSSRVHITQPYQLYSGTRQAAMEVVVLTPHSGWYYCLNIEVLILIHSGVLIGKVQL